MPGRVSARTKRSSEAELKRKSSAATLRSRGSARTSAHNQDIPDFGPDNELRQEIVQIFGEAQKAISSHRKLVVTLRKLQEACAFEQEGKKKKKKRIEGFSVDDFNHEFQRCVIFTLPVKKGVVEADRVVRFVGAFHKVAIEKGMASLRRQPRNIDKANATQILKSGKKRGTGKRFSTRLPPSSLIGSSKN